MARSHAKGSATSVAHTTTYGRGGRHVSLALASSRRSFGLRRVAPILTTSGIEGVAKAYTHPPIFGFSGFRGFGVFPPLYLLRYHFIYFYLFIYFIIGCETAKSARVCPGHRPSPPQKQNITLRTR